MKTENDPIYQLLVKLTQAAICEFHELIFGPAVKSQSCQRETTTSGETAGSEPGQGAHKESMDHLKYTNISVLTAQLSYISTKTTSYYVKSAWSPLTVQVIDVTEHDGALPLEKVYQSLLYQALLGETLILGFCEKQVFWEPFAHKFVDVQQADFIKLEMKNYHTMHTYCLKSSGAFNFKYFKK